MSALTRRSDTHEERYFHFEVFDPENKVYRGTVFMRKEDAAGEWFGRGTFCSEKDQFIRRLGRSRARQLYFKEKHYIGLYVDQKVPSYDAAAKLLEEEAVQRLGHNIRIFKK